MTYQIAALMLLKPRARFDSLGVLWARINAGLGWEGVLLCGVCYSG